MVVDAYDDLDRCLLHALQIDARAPFRRLAEVLGSSDQTVARRYARLQEAGAVRVVALSDPATVGDVQWTIRVQVEPAAVDDVATALAQRHDTAWITTCSGGTTIAGSIHARGRDPELLDALPGVGFVRDVEAERVLRVFYGGPGEPFDKHGPLNPAQIEALARHLPPATSAATHLDETDRRLLAVLRHDGRVGIEQLARRIGVSTATARRRLYDLRASRALHFDVDLDLQLLQRPIHTLVRLTIAPAQLTAAGQQLAADSAVGYTAATTGTTNLFASVTTTDLDELYRFLTTTVADLPGLQASTSAPVRHTYKTESTRLVDSPRDLVSRTQPH